MANQVCQGLTRAGWRWWW